MEKSEFIEKNYLRLSTNVDNLKKNNFQKVEYFIDLIHIVYYNRLIKRKEKTKNKKDSKSMNKSVIRNI